MLEPKGTKMKNAQEILANENQVFVDTDGNKYSMDEMKVSYPEVLEELETQGTMYGFYTEEEYEAL